MIEFYERLIKDRFKDRNSFTREDLLDFYLEYEPDIKKATFGWRIFDLRQKGIIRTIAKGVYVLSGKPEYKPHPSDKARKLARAFGRHLPGSNYCISETSWLNEFSIHQTNTSVIILEVDKDLLEPAFFTLKNEIKDLYLQPGPKEMEIYVLQKEDPVVLKSLISRSPTQGKRDKNLTVNLPHLEKLLVDVYCDRQIYFFYSGVEHGNIFSNAFDRYAVNLSRLRNYAKRRGKGIEVEAFISHEVTTAPPIEF
jgi:hypothetical protein